MKRVVLLVMVLSFAAIGCAADVQEEVRAEVERQLALMELPVGPEGPQGERGPKGDRGERGESGFEGGVLSLRELRIIDYLGVDRMRLYADAYGGTIVFNDSGGAWGSDVTALESGDLILRGPDGTTVCFWGDRVGACAVGEDGYLEFVE